MIIKYMNGDFDETLRLRRSLYFDNDSQQIHDELIECVQGNPYYDLWQIFVFQRENGGLGGFVEVGFINAEEYKDRLTPFVGTVYLEQIKMRLAGNLPIPVVESWYVDDDCRGNRVGSKLMAQAARW